MKKPRNQIAWELIQALNLRAVSSENAGVPEKVLPGDQLHSLARSYELTFPGQKAPAGFRQAWKRYLHFARQGNPQAFDEIDSLQSWLEAHHLPGQDEDAPREDGVDPNARFFWRNGKDHKLSFHQWRLLLALDQSREGKVLISSLCPAIWADHPTNNAVRQVVKRLNEKLKDIGTPLTISVDGEEIITI